MTLSDFGTFHETLPLDPSAPVGTYRVRVYQPGKSDFAGAFEVQSYQLEPIDLSFDLKKTVYYRGETIEADVVAKYQYGAPVANRPIEVTLPDQRVLQRHDRRHRQVPRELLRPRGSPRSRPCGWWPACRRTTWRPPRP